MRRPQGKNGCWGLYDATTPYLNRDDVRAAIHVRSTAEEEAAYGPTDGWGLCGMRGVSYDRGQTKNLLISDYPALAAAYRILIYNGDTGKLITVNICQAE